MLVFHLKDRVRTTGSECREAEIWEMSFAAKTSQTGTESRTIAAAEPSYYWVDWIEGRLRKHELI